MFLIPFNDTEKNRYGAFPFMTVALITVNVLVLGYEDLLSEQNFQLLVDFFQTYGSTPTLVLAGEGGGALTSITSLFIHSGILHLALNMLFLWAFGRRVEDATGPWRFLVFYLLCGVIADIVSTLVHNDATIPSIGASGAVFGVMGAYMLLYPSGRIRTLLLVVIVPLLLRLPAFLIVLYYFLAQLIPAYNILAYEVDYNVGYFAHLGGFFGSIFIFLFLRPEALYRYRINLPV